MDKTEKALWLAFGIAIHIAVIAASVTLIVAMIRTGMCHG